MLWLSLHIKYYANVEKDTHGRTQIGRNTDEQKTLTVENKLWEKEPLSNIHILNGKALKMNESYCTFPILCLNLF